MVSKLGTQFLCRPRSQPSVATVQGCHSQSGHGVTWATCALLALKGAACPVLPLSLHSQGLGHQWVTDELPWQPGEACALDQDRFFFFFFLMHKIKYRSLQKKAFGM